MLPALLWGRNLGPPALVVLLLPPQLQPSQHSADVLQLEYVAGPVSRT